MFRVRNLLLKGGWAFAAALALCNPQPGWAQTEPDLPWFGAWSEAASAEPASDQGPPVLTFSNQTLRQYVFTTIGGSAARLHFSNQYGTVPLTISDVHIGQAGSPYGNVIDGTDSPVTFQGQSSITIPVGQAVVSDGVAVPVPANAYMAISAYFPNAAAITDLTSHFFAHQLMQNADGDASTEPQLPFPANGEFTGSYFFLTSMDVQNPAATGTLVTLGASVTDGQNSTTDANHRWSNFLAQRFAAAGINVGILNQGIPGGEMLSDNGPIYGDSALHRFDRDVLSQPGVRWVVYSEFNDVGAGFPALQAGLQSMMNQAHARQMKFICSTLTPFSAPGTTNSSELIRQQYNAFIRTTGNGCDAVIDQDLATHDPNDTASYLPSFDSGDHLHPNDAGYQAIANAVPLGIFTQATALPPSAPSTSCVNGLTTNQTIASNAPLTSCDGRFSLVLQTNGNLVIQQGATTLWTSNTANLNIVQGSMLPTGNFVLRDTQGRQVWATNSDFNPGANLLMQNDGNLVIYNNNAPVWNTGSCCH